MQGSFAQESGRLETHLPDLIGLAWVEADIFLGVHDAKNKGTRVLVTLIPEETNSDFWQKVSETALAKIWDNLEEHIYHENSNNR